MRMTDLLRTVSVCLLSTACALNGLQAEAKPKIAVFSGPTATIQNSKPLITSNKARAQHNLPLLRDASGEVIPYDELFMQRLAAPVTVYIEQFSAHPLEADAAELFGQPDGYITADGSFSKLQTAPTDKPVYVATLLPEDGLYPLPYMARQRDGSAWDSTARRPGAPFEQSRQTFYPDASRIFEEIERSGTYLSSYASFDFYRPAPSAGYTKGLPEAKRTDKGTGDIPPESLGKDFFTYGPYAASTSRPHLARATNIVQKAFDTGEYEGGIWFEGSPNIEDSMYWLSLLIDTEKPLVGNAAQRAHGYLSEDGDANIYESVRYITSRAWVDSAGKDRVGAVLIQDQQIFNARELQKADARPGGYTDTGGHGGIVGSVGYDVKLSFISTRKSTHRSELKLPLLPATVEAVARTDGGLSMVPFAVKAGDGSLLPSAIPYVTIQKSARWQTDNDAMSDPAGQVELLARLDAFLEQPVLGGIVAEGMVSSGGVIRPADAALERIVLSGFPVVKALRGNAEGFPRANEANLFIEANNLTATKARILLMASLLKLGSLPPAKDPTKPTPAEIEAIKEKLKAYQAIFDTH